MQRHRLLRGLLALSLQVPPAVFVQTLARALQYGVVELATVERIAWLYLSQGEHTCRRWRWTRVTASDRLTSRGSGPTSPTCRVMAKPGTKKTNLRNQKGKTNVDEELQKILKHLRLGGLLAQWDELLAAGPQLTELHLLPAHARPHITQNSLAHPSSLPLPAKLRTAAYDARSLLYQLLGVDLCAMDGLNESTVQTIISETGTDLSAFPSEKHFCSWLGLAPHNDISGSKVLRSKTLKTANRAGQAFRLAAQSVARRPQTTFGAFYRRIRSRSGAQQAIVATAHKIARAFYHMLKHRVPYHDLGGAEYERRVRERALRNLERRAAKLGMTLSPSTAGTA